MEYNCCVRTAFNCAHLGRPLPIAEIGGIVLTDFGLAQVGEKITASDGEIAETLQNLLIKNQMTPERLKWLNAFARDLIAVNVNAPDLSGANVMIDETKRRFVMVDGYGDKTLIPIRSWVRSLNQGRILERFAELEKFGHLKWDPDGKSFSLME